VRFLVTDGTGFIGSHLVNRLLQLGHEVVVTGRRNKSTPEQVRVLYPSLLGVDLNALGHIDVLYHLDGLHDVRIQDAAELERVNAVASLEVFQRVIDNGCKHIIFTSSVAVYGNTCSVPFQESTTAPISSYGQSLRLMERAVRTMNGFYPEVIFIGLRLANPYGPGEALYGRAPSMVYRMAIEARIRPPILFKDGSIQRDFVYIEDIVAAFLKAISAQSSVTVNCGSGESISYNELFYLVRRILKVGQSWTSPKYIPNVVKDMQEHTWCDMSRAWEQLGFKPAYSINDGLKAYQESGQLR